MAACAWTPSALTWLRVNHLINGLHKQISCKNCLYAVNSYFTLVVLVSVVVVVVVLSECSHFLGGSVESTLKSVVFDACSLNLQLSIRNFFADCFVSVFVKSLSFNHGSKMVAMLSSPISSILSNQR